MGCGASKPAAVGPAEGGHAGGAPAERPGELSPGPPSKMVRQMSESGPGAKPLESRYTVGKVLGRGGFGEVREAIRKSDGKK